MTRRIGIFGGSFDPVHRAHVALARKALDQLQLDEVRWIPTGHSWQKTRQLAAAEHREAMIQLAIDGEARFANDLCEIRRSGPSYTLDTVRELQAAEPGNEWFLIIGRDQYAGLHTWVDWPELLSRVTLAVADRPGVPVSVNPEVLRFSHRAVPLPLMDLSSTDIRQRIARGQGIDDLVPPAIARYIDQHHLYRGTPGS